MVDNKTQNVTENSKIQDADFFSGLVTFPKLYIQ